MIFEKQAQICKALSDPKRLMVVHELRDGEKTVGELMGSLGLPQGNLSQHLGVMRDKGLVVAQRRGNNVFYSLASPMISRACDIVRQVLTEQLESSQVLVNELSGTE
ncbi:ArsR/SmtB family transcription factor [Chloroflexota bacterium]